MRVNSFQCHSGLGSTLDPDCLEQGTQGIYMSAKHISNAAMPGVRGICHIYTPVMPGAARDATLHMQTAKHLPRIPALF